MYTVAQVLYPDATNFEGRKILVFNGPKALRLREMKEIDPHFCEGDDLGLIARFHPKQMELARLFAQSLAKRK